MKAAETAALQPAHGRPFESRSRRLLTISVFFMFGLFPPALLSSRVSFVLGLLFAIVGLRFSTSALLPKLEFMTLAQREINFAVWLVFAVMTENVVLAVISRTIDWNAPQPAQTTDARSETFARVTLIVDAAACAIILILLVRNYAHLLGCRAAHLAKKPSTRSDKRPLRRPPTVLNATAFSRFLYSAQALLPGRRSRTRDDTRGVEDATIRV